MRGLLTKFISAAFAVLILAVGAVTAHGAGKGSRPRTTPAPRPTPPLTADIGSSYSNSKVPYSIDHYAILTAIGHPDVGVPNPIGYGDFNGDGIADVAFAPLSGTMTGSPVIIALGQTGGSYIDGTTQVISGEVPRRTTIASYDFRGRAAAS
jgi:hypothetical protein